MKITGFDGYTYLDSKVFNSKGREIAFTDGCCKMKNNDGKWKRLSLSKIKAIVGDIYCLDGFKEIPNTEGKYFINEVGKVVSFKGFGEGKELTIYYPKDEGKYPTVNLTLDGVDKKVSLHKLLAVTYIDKDYVEKGLVCMHLDNNKNNHVLSNIKVGTYSENNKQAYDDGLNVGNRGQ